MTTETTTPTEARRELARKWRKESYDALLAERDTAHARIAALEQALVTIRAVADKQRACLGEEGLRRAEKWRVESLRRAEALEPEREESLDYEMYARCAVDDAAAYHCFHNEIVAALPAPPTPDPGASLKPKIQA